MEDVVVVAAVAAAAKSRHAVDVVCRALVAAARRRVANFVKPYDTYVSTNFYIEYECVVSIECNSRLDGSIPAAGG